MSSTNEKEVASQSGSTCNHYADALRDSAAFRKEYGERRDVVKANEMPMERSPDGLIKHIVNEKMNTKECCVDIYMQFLEAGKASGKHRHLSEEIFYVV